jgi:kynurenine formamidase
VSDTEQKNPVSDTYEAKGVRHPQEPTGERIVSQPILAQFMTELVSGRIRLVDLTETLTPEFPTIVLPPEFGQAWPFRIEEISRYDERGPAWYWNNFSCSEHTGTHFDAPAHWVTGKDQPDNTVDTIPIDAFIASACVIDCSAQAAGNPDFLLTIDFVKKWEEQHGRIPARSWVLMRTDWSKRAKPAEYLNMQADGAHSPGPDAEVVPWLIKERDVHGFGTESVGTDAGQAQHLDPPYPCHYYMHGNNRYGLQCLTNLDQLPATGAVIFSAPLKIRSGSGSPLRVLALAPTA